MRVVLQRVSSASVSVDEVVIGEIARGFLILAGFTHVDTREEVAWMADKILALRLFSDDDGKMNLRLADVEGALLIVSQFTLYGDARKGRRPSFIDAASPEVARPLYELLVEVLRESGIHVATGEFGGDMRVSLVNDGPVTLVLERDAGAR